MHTTGVPAHTPAWQLSPVVHALPSLHAVPLAATGLEQMPLAGSQVPARWHWSEAGHVTAVPMQTPAWHRSPVVHAAPSLHVVPLATTGLEHVPLAGSQVPAAWHWSDAGQVTGVPVQAPAWQASPVVQRLPSEHAVPLSTFASGGHAGPFPGQSSATSHGPVATRHSVAAETNESPGQSAAVPSQASATSHGPAAGRQTEPALAGECWQVTAVPSQRSNVHALPSSGQAVPAGCTVSAGQTGPFPGQSSALSQTPAGARHWVVDGAKRSAGQAALVPSQLSATSQTPAAARQTALAFPGGCWHAMRVPSH